MAISKEDILDKTHYGLNVYAHILRKYYPDQTVLSLSGRDCSPAKNPFNQSKVTLKVCIQNNKAIHFDSDRAIPEGDAFDFAELHYKMQGVELLQVLNDEMYLRIDKVVSRQYQGKAVEPVQYFTVVQNPVPKFSYFKSPVSNTTPSGEVSIVDVYQLLVSSAFKNSTSSLREIQDLKEARKFKALNFDYVTFSGVFSKRMDSQLKKHSGMMAIDFDHVPDLNTVKEKLLHDKFFETQLLFVSPSGDGLKWIIKIDQTQVTHQEYFKAVSNYIKFQYDLTIDPAGKDVSRACFLPYDDKAFINPQYLKNE